MTIKKEIKANVTYHPDGYRISHKCAICGKEMLPCGLTRKYCKKSCQKVGWFNAEYHTDYKTLEECKEIAFKERKKRKIKSDNHGANNPMHRSRVSLQKTKECSPMCIEFYYFQD